MSAWNNTMPLFQCPLRLLVLGAGQLGSRRQDCACGWTGGRARLLVALRGEGREENIKTVVCEDHSICQVIISIFHYHCFICFCYQYSLKKLMSPVMCGQLNIQIHSCMKLKTISNFSTIHPLPSTRLRVVKRFLKHVIQV